eukprot:COSAG03_NODE_7658_length_887_cov_12.984787_1_plen_64_part_10
MCERGTEGQREAEAQKDSLHARHGTCTACCAVCHTASDTERQESERKRTSTCKRKRKCKRRGRQ